MVVIVIFISIFIVTEKNYIMLSLASNDVCPSVVAEITLKRGFNISTRPIVFKFGLNIDIGTMHVSKSLVSKFKLQVYKTC